MAKLVLKGSQYTVRFSFGFAEASITDHDDNDETYEFRGEGAEELADALDEADDVDLGAQKFLDAVRAAFLANFNK